MSDVPGAAPGKVARWKAIDLDGTLARYDGWVSVEHIGEPVPEMLARVKGWLAKGKDVRIFTARVDGIDPRVNSAKALGENPREAARAREVIEAWCLKHVGQVLPVTCRKDFAMEEIWDDRAVSVEANTGRVTSDSHVEYQGPASSKNLS